MSLFPRLHYGESMIDFEKSTFFHREVIFHAVRELPRAIFDVKTVDTGAHETPKSSQKMQNNVRIL